MLETGLFYLCGGLLLLGAVMTVCSRSAVSGAVWLIFAFLNLAGLFALLAAPLVAILQVLVYAGAIMVLFLFVIMMLQERSLPAERRRRRLWSWAAVLLPVGVLAGGGAAWVAARGGGAAAGRGFPPLAPGAPFGSAEQVSHLLLDRYLLAFELISIVLLVAIIGAVALGRGERKAS